MTAPVFSYTNYRVFLHDHFGARKRANPRWSIRAWSRQLGLSGPSMLTMILKGERNPGDALVDQMVKHIGMEPDEAAYFRDLVELSKAEGDERQSVTIMERLARQRPSGEFRELSREAFLAISRWHYYAIREMTRLAHFREDAEWIAKRLQFRVTPGEIKDAIRTLLKLGLLARDADGRLTLAGGHIATTNDVADEAIKRFHEGALENAKESVRKHAPEAREFFGTTFATPRSKLPQAKALIRKFHQEFCHLLEEGGSDAVYQLEIGFYPLAVEEKE